MKYVSLRSVFVSAMMFLLCGCPLENKKKDGNSPFQSGGGGGGNNNPTPTPDTSTNSPIGLFNNSIKPKFQASCAGCHSVGNTGPLTIFSYNSMKTMILNGGGTQTNQLIKYLRGQSPYNHTGINYCGAGLFPAICDALVQWRIAEAGDSNENEPAVGDVQAISKVSGIIVGWVVDPNSQSSVAQVRVYANGPMGTGTLIGTYNADQPLTGVAFSGNHGFRFQVPNQYRDGNARNLYFYGLDLGGGPAALLSRGTVGIQLWAPTAAGMQYYENTVRPMMVNRCGGCHGATYESDYARMAIPYPSDGATKTSNNLIDKARGINHGGGNICGNINGAPCLELQNWWDLEF